MVYGVNPAGARSHTRYVEKLALPFALVYDKGGRIAFKYRCGFGPIVRRTVYVIGPDGTIAASWRGTPAVGEILAAL